MMITDFKIIPLPLIRKDNLLQAFDIEIIADRTDELHRAGLKVKRNKNQFEIDLGYLKKGSNSKEIFLPEVQHEQMDEFFLYYGDEKISRKITVKPVRKWEIFLVLHSHTDLGFTAPVSEVAQIHNDNTDTAILYCKETEHWPEGSRFKWTCEVSWQIQNYLSQRSPEKVEELIQLIKKGSMEIGALYSGELTEILGHEQAVRSFYYSAKLRNKYGIKIHTAMLCDVPGCTKGFVQIMAKSGIKNLIIADNNFIAPFLPRTDLPRPFYWEGDDNSRVLSWYTDHPFYAYIEGENYGLSQSYLQTRRKLPQKLIELEKNGYQYDEFQLQYAFDNFRIEFRPAAVVREWNEQWAYPQVRLANASEFLNLMNEKYSAQIPVRKADWTNWWSGIVSGFPAETKKSRKLHQKIPSLEILNSFLITEAEKTLTDSFGKMYDQTLAFDEHSGSGMVWEPESEEQQIKALTEGYGFIEEPFLESIKIEEQLKAQLAKLINNDSTEDKIVVFNLSDFKRSGKIKIQLHERELNFFAEDVPPLGFKIINLNDQRSFRKTLGYKDSQNAVIENDYYKIKTDLIAGKVNSIFSKEAAKELTDDGFNHPLLYVLRPKVPFQMGKYIPEMYNGDEVPGELICFHEKMNTQTDLIEDEYGSFIRIEHSFDDIIWLTQNLYLEDCDVIIENILSGTLMNDANLLKKYLNDSGMLYLQFSLNYTNPYLRYDAPCAVIAPESEQFKGTCKDHYAVQNWIQLHDDNTALNFSSPDAPLVDLGAISLMKYRNDFTGTPQNLFVRLASLNEFNGRSRSPYSKNEDISFRFSLSAEKFREETSLANAFKFGERNNKELVAAVIPSGNNGLINAAEYSFAEIFPDYLQVMTIKTSEDRNGIILRIRETSGRKTDCVINFPGKKINSCYRCMMTEEKISELKVEQNKISLELNPYSVETIRLKMK